MTNKTDLRNGIRDIRTNSIRYFEKNVSEAVVATEQGNADVQENFWL